MVSSVGLRTTPVHRWFTFPHSFSFELVDRLIDEWSLTPGDRILDPFVGAGTTLLAARARSIRSVGVDLSPLAVFASRTKLAAYRSEHLIPLANRIIDRAAHRCGAVPER